MNAIPIAPADLPLGRLPFSPGIQVGNLVFTSGQASTDNRGNIVEGTFAEEMDRTMNNVVRILEEAGCSLNDVVQVRSYLATQDDAAEYNELYRNYFSAPLPARTTLSGCLVGIKFEIDVIAVIPATES